MGPCLFNSIKRQPCLPVDKDLKMSNTGRHFTPPSPAFRQQDPFSTHVPMSAEKVPSCKTSSPMESDDSVQPQSTAEKPFIISTPNPTVIFDSKTVHTSQVKRLIQVKEGKARLAKQSQQVASPVKNTAVKTESVSKTLSKKVKETPQKTPAKSNFYRLCEWEKCGKKFLVKNSGRSASKRYCSATCRGRASESRKGKN